MRTLLLIVSTLLLYHTSLAQNTAEGEKIFNSTCKTCHSIGKGKIVGPDLKNVHQRRQEAWLLKFIKSPGETINSGDAEAKKLFEENNKILMPDHKFLSEGDIKNIIAFISGKSTEETVPPQENSEIKNIIKQPASDEATFKSSPLSTVDYIIYGLTIVSLTLVLIILSILWQIYRFMKPQQNKI